MQFSDLSPRQQQVMILEAEGMSTSKEIAHELGITPQAVRNHRRAIHHQLDDAGVSRHGDTRQKSVLRVRWLWEQGIALPEPAESPVDLYTIRMGHGGSRDDDARQERQRITAMAMLILHEHAIRNRTVAA